MKERAGRTAVAALAVVCVGAAHQARAGVLDELAALEWRARVVLLVAPAATAPGVAEARALVEARTCEFRARDMQLVEALGAAAGLVAERYGLGPGDAAVVLIGKDGGEKYRERLGDRTPFDLQAVFERIDGMPMRQAERRRRGEPRC